MADNKESNRALLLMALLAIWAAAWGYSFYFALTAAPAGDGFTRGMNRITGFVGWQAVAGMFAFAAWGVGRSFAAGLGIRRISAIPLLLAGVLIAGILAVIGWGLLTHP